MIPTIKSLEQIHTKRGKYASKTWVVDRQRGRIVKQCDGLEAVYQSVQKILTTSRYSELIYSSYYGVELVDMIGKPMVYAKSAIAQALKEALRQDDRVLEVRVEGVESVGDSLSVSLSIRCELGTIEMLESIRVG